MLPQDIAQYIDHTLLKSDATSAEIKKLCQEAIVNNFYGVCINSAWIALVKNELANSKTKIVCVVGFPLGACLSEAKAFEAMKALEQGADEIDMVLNISALKEKNYFLVKSDIQQVVQAAKGKTVKVILETHLLSNYEKEEACKIAVQAGAQFVKTSTGFTGGGATKEDVILMKKAVGDLACVKASGGVKTFEQAVEMINAGAQRIGTSSGVAIVSKTLNPSSNHSNY